MNRHRRASLLDRLSRQLFTHLSCYRDKLIDLLVRVVGHYLQGCSTLSTEFPLEERIGSGKSGSISILTEC